MSRTGQQSRRDFVKTAAAGAAVASLAGMGAREARAAGLAWTNGMNINPRIDNLRVVCCLDPTMVKSNPSSFSSFDTVNDAIDAAKVAANLDAMAKALANTSTAAEGWRTIFQMPSGKTAGQVRVAIKVNCINGANMPRVAIVDKICRVLNGIMGIPFANMVIYDGCSNANGGYGSYPGTRLPAGVVVSNGNGSLGGTMSAAVPGVGNVTCTRDIASGAIDILVNVAVNKGHDGTYGTCTLTMKNHYGTFNPNAIHSTAGVLGISKSDAIVGGTPVRQQLCIVDSLFASNGGPGGTPDKRPDRLVMGVFSPAVDYLTVKKIREPIMGATHNATVVARFLSDFGLTAPANYDFINVPPAASTGVYDHTQPLPRTSATLNVVVFSPRVVPTSAALELPLAPGALRVEVLDLRGNVLRRLNAGRYQAQSLTVSWDGTANGRALPAGTYAVRARMTGFDKTVPLSLVWQ